MVGINLPHTEAYTLAEIASKWGCNETKLVDFYRSDKLEICAYIDNALALDLHALYTEDKNEKLTIDGLHLLFKSDLLKIAEANYEHTDYHTIKYAYDEIADGDSIVFGNSNWPYELITPINLNSAALRISHEEMERFEEDNALFKQGAEAPPNLPKARPIKQENLLRTIGGLSLILASQGRKWGKEGQPNVSAISQAIQQLATKLGVPDYGQRKSTLSKDIPAGLKIFLDG